MALDLDIPALVPIDMQTGFDLPSWPSRWNDAIDRNGLLILEAWRAAGLPIFHVRHDSVEVSSTLRPGHPGNAFRQGFAPVESEALITKSVNAAFIGTDLDLRLRRAGISTLVLFGISTDMCVSTSARVGANLGYRVIVVEDACDCFDLSDGDGAIFDARTVHDVHIATLRYEFATITTTAELLGALKSITRVSAQG